MALSAKKVQALEFLQTGMSIPKAAEKVGVRRETLWNWTKDPEFSAALPLYKSSSPGKEALDLAVVEAVETLRGVLRDEESTPRNKIDAAKVILERAKSFSPDAMVKMRGTISDMDKWFSAAIDD